MLYFQRKSLNTICNILGKKYLYHNSCNTSYSLMFRFYNNRVCNAEVITNMKIG